MYSFASSDIKVFRKSQFYTSSLEIYNKALFLSDTNGLHHVSDEAKLEFLSLTNPHNLVSKYPMSYFCYTGSEDYCIERKESSIQEVLGLISYGERKIAKLTNKINLHSLKTSSKKEAIIGKMYRNDLAFANKNLQSFKEGLQSLYKLDPLTDISNRNMFISASTSIDSPAWWTWLHCCEQMSQYVMPSILRASYPDIKLYVCSTPSHTFLSNTRDIDTIKNLCKSNVFTRDVSSPAIFDMIQQVYCENDRKIQAIYDGDITIKSIKTSIADSNYE